ncbi:hypothetical protein FQZ97_959810 [compost metagenome]
MDFRAVGHAPDHQVQLAHTQLRQQVGARPGEHADHQRGVPLVQALHHFRQQQAFYRGQHAQAHGAGGVLALAQAVHPIAQGLYARAGVAHEGQPRLGQAGASLAALEQAGVEDFLQLLEGLGNGRLAHRQLVRCAGQAALAGDLEEAQQVAEFDAGIDVQRRVPGVGWPAKASSRTGWGAICLGPFVGDSMSTPQSR